MEFQEWFRLRALPAMQACADRHFFRRPQDPLHWFSASMQQSLERLIWATQFDSSCHKKFLISHDQDSRHCMLHYPVTPSGKRGKPFDRRAVKAGKQLHIPVHAVRDYVPTAPRVPDCIQSPIEMFFAPIKTHYKKLMTEHRKQGHSSSFSVVEQMSRQAFRDKGGADRVFKCWEHAVNKSLRVFATPYKQWITVGDDRSMGVGVNWVPKKYSG